MTSCLARCRISTGQGAAASAARTTSKTEPSWSVCCWPTLAGTSGSGTARASTSSLPSCSTSWRGKRMTLSRWVYCDGRRGEGGDPARAWITYPMLPAFQRHLCPQRHGEERGWRCHGELASQPLLDRSVGRWVYPGKGGGGVLPTLSGTNATRASTSLLLSSSTSWRGQRMMTL